jgi:hypothetical protein
MCVVPTFGPARLVKSTFTPSRGFPQLFMRVALTVAVVPTSHDWVDGVRVRTARGHGGFPMGVHCVDLFRPLGQGAASIPPVLKTCPVSANVVVTPFTVTSISGIMLEFVHTPVRSTPREPLSEASNCPFVVQPPSPLLAVCVTMNSPPKGNAIGDDQRLKVHVSKRTITALTVSVPPVLFTIRTAPVSRFGQSGHPLKITPGEPSHGVGKFTEIACARSA